MTAVPRPDEDWDPAFRSSPFQPLPGNALRLARRAAGLSLREFAQLLNVSIACASRWERDLRRPHSSDMMRIAALLGVPRATVHGWFRGLPPVRTDVVRSTMGLRRLRESAGLTRKQLAHLLDVEPETLAHWECGRRAMPRARIAQLAEVMSMPAPLVATVIGRGAPSRPVSALATLRRRAGLSQQQVGNTLGVSNVTVSCWERRRSVPSWPQLRDLADLYGVPLAQVAGIVGRDRPDHLDQTQWRREDLPKILKTLREWRGETRSSVAARAGVHASTLARWEEGISAPNALQRRRLAGALGLRHSSMLWD